MFRNLHLCCNVLYKLQQLPAPILWIQTSKQIGVHIQRGEENPALCQFGSHSIAPIFLPQESVQEKSHQILLIN